MIWTSNKSVAEMARVFGDEALATRILDLLLHHADTITVDGPSYGPKGPLRR